MPALTNPLDRAARLRDTLTKYLRDREMIRTARVEAAFRNVPRHLFVPDVDLDQAYSDEAISVKQQEGISISSSSQPAIMALMLEQLDVRPGHKVLEIGAGTGYNAALLAHLVGEEGHVVSVELDEDLAEKARQHIEAAGYTDRVEVICDDGGYGYPEGAPYDRIILTVSAWDITPSWWTQLKKDGRLVLPLSLRGPQVSATFENQKGVLKSLTLEPCGFMNLRGEFAAQVKMLILGPEQSIHIDTELPHAPAASILETWLHDVYSDYDTGIDVTPREIGCGVETWLALNEPGYSHVLATGAGIDANRLPTLFGYEGAWRARFTSGIMSSSGLCLLSRAPDQPLPEDGFVPKAFRMWLRCFGDDAGLAARTLNHLKAWDTAGRPGSEALQLKVYPAQQAISPEPDTYILPRRWTIITARWPESQ
jgi:protein-L-isoaspartate(D-aspartate) O-methyltransferase